MSRLPGRQVFSAKRGDGRSAPWDDRTGPLEVLEDRTTPSTFLVTNASIRGGHCDGSCDGRSPGPTSRGTRGRPSRSLRPCGQRSRLHAGEISIRSSLTIENGRDAADDPAGTPNSRRLPDRQQPADDRSDLIGAGARAP